MPRWKQTTKRTQSKTAAWCIDHMPYGGVKESGTTREGVRYAIEEMTEMKLMVVKFEAT